MVQRCFKLQQGCLLLVSSLLQLTLFIWSELFAIRVSTSCLIYCTVDDVYLGRGFSNPKGLFIMEYLYLLFLNKQLKLQTAITRKISLKSKNVADEKGLIHFIYRITLKTGKVWIKDMQCPPPIQHICHRLITSLFTVRFFFCIFFS